MALRNPAAIAEQLSCSQQTLANWRSCGKGPAFTKVGGRVMYQQDDVDSWLQGQRRTSTAQNSAGNSSAAA